MNAIFSRLYPFPTFFGKAEIQEKVTGCPRWYLFCSKRVLPGYSNNFPVLRLIAIVVSQVDFERDLKHSAHQVV